MSTILSLSRSRAGLWASGPEGLWLYQNDTTDPVTILQPHEQLYCSVNADSDILVGGVPRTIAFSTDGGGSWRSAYVNDVAEAALCLAPDPRYLETGVILAGTAGGGILRTDNRGQHWSLCNFGLENFTILHVAWAPLAEPGTWPNWEVVFAATEDGLYRSPNGGLGWRRCVNTDGIFIVAAPSLQFPTDGLVLAGTEEEGVWRSCDGGRHFEQLQGTPDQINALVSTPIGWLLGNNHGIYRSIDGDRWSLISGGPPALTLLVEGDTLWIGTEDGLARLSLSFG